MKDDFSILRHEVCCQCRNANSEIDEGTFSPDMDVKTTAALIMQTVLGAMRLRVLGAELNGVPIEEEHIFTFCVRTLAK